MQTIRLALFVLLTSGALVACQTKIAQVDRMVGAHQPAEYKLGYAEGCDSGYVAAGNPYYRFSKDVARFGTDPLYKSGWEDGFAVCKGSYDSMGRR